jgi:hypothetical protein
MKKQSNETKALWHLNENHSMLSKEVSGLPGRSEFSKKFGGG